MSAHTPGPWKLDRVIESNKADYTNVVRPLGWGAANIAVVDIDANARLIAAAPEMLALIEHLLRVQAIKGNEVARAVEVLKKARGEI